MIGKILKLFSRKAKASREAALPEKRGGTATASPVETPTPQSSAATPEELCELKDGMTHEELKAHLAKLYRRHNRAASSLNPELREQAERMLDAIVEVRHRYLDGEG